VLAGDLECGGGGGVKLVRVRAEFVEDGGEALAVGIECGDQEAWVQRRRSVVPAAAEGVADRLLEVRGQGEIAERAAGAQVPADLAGVEPVDGIEPELPLDLAADLVEVDAERGEQGRGVEAGSVTAAGADDEPDGVAGPVQGDAAVGQQVTGGRCAGVAQDE